MYVWGYCYSHGAGKTGINPEIVATEKEAREEIGDRLAGKVVRFVESNGKYRAYADDVPTDYIYFTVPAPEQWLLIDKHSLGIARQKSVLAKGSLADVKRAVRKEIDKDCKMFKHELLGVDFIKTVDNFEVHTEVAKNGRRCTGYVLVRA